MQRIIDLIDTFEKIQQHSFKIVGDNSADFGEEADVKKLSEAFPLPKEFLDEVPEIYIELCGKEEGITMWKNHAITWYIATLAYANHLRTIMLRLFRELLTEAQKKQRFMYIGKNGRNYDSLAVVREENRLYVQQENRLNVSPRV